MYIRELWGPDAPLASTFNLCVLIFVIAILEAFNRFRHPRHLFRRRFKLVCCLRHSALSQISQRHLEFESNDLSCCEVEGISDVKHE